MAAILDLSNMAATEGAHLGSLEKLVGDGYTVQIALKFIRNTRNRNTQIWHSGANTRHQYAFVVNTRDKKRSAYYKTRIDKRFITGSIAQYFYSMYTRLSMVLSHSYTRITIRRTINVPRQNKRTIFLHIRVLREYAVVLYITINMPVEMKTTKRSNIPLNRI